MYNLVPVPLGQWVEEHVSGRIRMTCADLVGSDTNKVTVLVMQTDELKILVTLENVIHVPEPSEGRTERPGDVAQGRKIPPPDTNADNSDDS